MFPHSREDVSHFRQRGLRELRSLRHRLVVAANAVVARLQELTATAAVRLNIDTTIAGRLEIDSCHDSTVRRESTREESAELSSR